MDPRTHWVPSHGWCPGTARVGSTSGAASISIVSLGQAGEANLVGGIEAFGIASLPAGKGTITCVQPCCWAATVGGAPPRTGRLDRQPQLPEENRAVEFRGLKDPLRGQQCSNGRAGSRCEKGIPRSTGHCGATTPGKPSRPFRWSRQHGPQPAELEPSPGTHMTGWGNAGLTTLAGSESGM